MDRPAVVGLLFHKIFKDQAEIDQNHVIPLEGATVEHFRRLIAFYSENDYQFITCDDVLEGLKPERNYALLSFDDGYANNLRVLPVLKEFGAKATIFVTTAFVEQQKAFWWDVLFRERHRRNTPNNEILREKRTLRYKPCDEIEAYLRKEFGPDILSPLGELDRPLSEKELCALSDGNDIEIGNHTVDHGYLTTLDRKQCEAQIAKSQDYLERTTGRRPRSIAYPFGDYDSEVVDIAASQGLELGLTCEPYRNHLPLQDSPNLTLGRFQPFADSLFLERCNDCRMDFSLMRSAKSIKDRFLGQGVGAEAMAAKREGV
jgi:peptidoglycan/xylan/chitin deacetylase (PgdA/CDA1 family)